MSDARSGLVPIGIVPQCFHDPDGSGHGDAGGLKAAVGVAVAQLALGGQAVLAQSPQTGKQVGATRARHVVSQLGMQIEKMRVVHGD